jgi:hypothetical protein
MRGRGNLRGRERAADVECGHQFEITHPGACGIARGGREHAIGMARGDRTELPERVEEMIVTALGRRGERFHRERAHDLRRQVRIGRDPAR